FVPEFLNIVLCYGGFPAILPDISLSATAGRQFLGRYLSRFDSIQRLNKQKKVLGCWATPPRAAAAGGGKRRAVSSRVCAPCCREPCRLHARCCRNEWRHSPRFRAPEPQRKKADLALPHIEKPSGHPRLAAVPLCATVNP